MLINLMGHCKDPDYVNNVEIGLYKFKLYFVPQTVVYITDNPNCLY